MCGIAGFLGQSSHPIDHAQTIKAMLARIEHRGPDEQGYMVDDHGALGNARLSIIDLASGSQPIATPDNRYWIAYNGETFNYRELRKDLEERQARFSTTCDTEVVLWGLAIHGPEFLKAMNGQFAVAFYDREKRTLLLARDRLGERPLYVARRGNSVVYASEIKALAAHPAIGLKLSARAVRDVLYGWSTMPATSAFEGIEEIAPGSYLEVSPEGIAGRTYDRIVSRALAAGRRSQSLADSAAQVRAALDRSVALRLRADLEVGAYVSGGLDSTITAGLARRQLSTQLRTFSIRFGQTGFDEGGFQSDVVEAIGSKHTEIRIGVADYEAALPDVVRHAEAPLYRMAPLPMYLLAKAVRQHGIRVVLTGEGADEFFLGYDIYRETLTRLALESAGSDAAGAAAVEALYPYLEHFRGAGSAGILQFFRSHAGRTDDVLYSHRPRLSFGDFGIRLLSGDVTNSLGDYREEVRTALAARHPDLGKLDPVDRAIVLESELLLGGYLLSSQGDRMASAHAVEGRYPFLDPDLIETACRLPRDHCLKDGKVEKLILKEAFGDIVPRSVIERPKHPFRAPDAHLLLKGEARRHLPTDAEVASLGIFDAAKVRRFLDRLEPEKASQRELQALTVIVTTHLLQKELVAKGSRGPAEPTRITRSYDLRTV
ncbi:MAG: asparagine synthase (glutamine-hydrolyzing) [Hyphomicrobiaceae bacterium]|nr:asparagine synthase (glutamine-hydrolyzing) [Hyphomicrobiaceae bacterium]